MDTHNIEDPYHSTGTYLDAPRKDTTSTQMTTNLGQNQEATGSRNPYLKGEERTSQENANQGNDPQIAPRTGTR